MSKNKEEIVEALNRHICGYNYVNVISYLALKEIFLYNEKEFILPQNSLSYDEWIFVIGLWLKNISKEPVRDILTIADVESEAKIIIKLLEELHYSYVFQIASIENSNAETLSESMKKVLDSPTLIQEAIFYGGIGAYDLQYTSLIGEKYKYDRDWILQNKGVDIDKFQSFYLTLLQLLHEKMDDFHSNISKTNHNTNYGITFPYMIDIAKIIGVDADYRQIVDVLSFDINNPPEISINGLEDFNPLVEYPLIRIDKDHLFISNRNVISNALYELPFFWMIHNDEYYKLHGVKNRGDAAEAITKKLLDRIFPSENVYRNVQIIQNKTTCSEIDVLVVYEDIAMIFQVKSKRLSQSSRKGNKESIANDFQKAIGKAYEQALASESKLKEVNSCIYTTNGKIIKFCINRTIKIGITLDYFPAVEAILRRGLDVDIPFISMSVFDLDVLTRYLSAGQFVDYVTYRVEHRKYMFSSNEAGYLGFYLKHNGFVDVEKRLKNNIKEGYDFVVIGNDYAHEVDKRMIRDLNNEFLPDLYKK